MPTKKTFRDGSYYRSVWMGKRTVKEGECAAIWNMSGERKKIEGPQRVRLWFSHVRFLDKHTADQSQYLVCQYRNGRREHMSVVGGWQCQPRDQVFVAGNPAVRHGLVHQFDGARQLSCEFRSVLQQIPGPFVLNIVRPSRCEQTR